MASDEFRLRPVVVGDLAMFQRLATEPHLVGLDWSGFRDAQEPARRFATDGYLGPDGGRLMIELDENAEAVGFLTWRRGELAAECWEIGIILMPAWRGRGIGWRAQDRLCEYLFEHTPVQRIQAGTHPDNVAEQRSLEKAGFQLEGVIRSCEFRAGQWRDGWLYSRLRDDPRPG